MHPPLPALRRLGAGLALLLVLAGPAFAHGELNELIASLSIEIQQRPDDVTLYLRRAELRRRDLDWEGAEADLRRAEALAPANPHPTLCRAALLLDQSRDAAARALLDGLLEREPGLSPAWALRAEVLGALGLEREAVADLDRAIATAPHPTPDLYLERARRESALGPDGPARALRGLDEGLRRIGPAVALDEAALELEIGLGRIEAALERLDRRAAQAPNPASVLARRAEVLAAAGRTLEAWAAWTDALAALERLPAERRRSPAISDLESRIRATLTTDRSPGEAP